MNYILKLLHIIRELQHTNYNTNNQYIKTQNTPPRKNRGGHFAPFAYILTNANIQKIFNLQLLAS